MTAIIKITEQLESTLILGAGTSFPVLDKDPDVIDQLLNDTRSESTRRAYARDLHDFFVFASNQPPNQSLCLEFLHLEQGQAIAVVLKFKSHLVNTRKLAENTVNRKLAAIRSLVAMGNRLGVCAYTLADHVKSEKTQRYRDTSGIQSFDYKKVLALVNRETIKGKRDYAILRLLWDNALRRNELVTLDVSDFDSTTATLSILGKGKGSQKTQVKLTAPTTAAIVEYLLADGRASKLSDPLFKSCAYHKTDDGRLTGETIRALIDNLCKRAGISKKMSPHRIRHSSITTALEHSNGNYQKVQTLSRHASLDTIKIYDDNRMRSQQQQELSNLLGDLI